MDIILDVENVCFEFGNSFEFEGINLETIQLSLNLLESLFSMNDDLFVDLVNHKCCNVLFIDWNKHLVILCPKYLFQRKGLLGITKLPILLL
jgi:hypothetical protein